MLEYVHFFYLKNCQKKNNNNNKKKKQQQKLNDASVDADQTTRSATSDPDLLYFLRPVCPNI